MSCGRRCSRSWVLEAKCAPARLDWRDVRNDRGKTAGNGEREEGADVSGAGVSAQQNSGRVGAAVPQQPYDVEVGAGTMSPDAHFCACWEPKPVRIAYTQPSRRPAADGRYGENPNRLLYRHTQLPQLVLKPPPENIQELYLESAGGDGD